MTGDEASLRAEIAVGLIVAADGRLLLQHRDDKPDLNGAGLWGSFGGHVEPGETIDDAFLREIDEELGWRPRHFEHYLTRDVEYAGGQPRYSQTVAFTSHVFAAHLDVPVEALTLGEGQAMALYPPDAPPAATVPGLVDIIATFAGTSAYKRLRHDWDFISATALIIDAHGRFLLQHRDDNPEITHPGLWGSFGGRVEPYETPEAGFLREMDEELAWRPASHELYLTAPFRQPAGDDAGNQIVYVYAAPLDLPLKSLVLNEGAGLDVFAPEALPASIVPQLRTLIERFAQTDRYVELTLRARA